MLGISESGYALTDGTDYLSVLQGLGRVYEHSAEHLHVDAAVEHLDQAVIRLSGQSIDALLPCTHVSVII